MTTRASLRSIGLLSLMLAQACDGATPAPDAGTRDASIRLDGDAPPDASNDGGACMQVSVATWRLELVDDVSVRYRARIAPAIGGDPWDLYLEFNRYETDYVGEFPLGEGQDANNGGCARCVKAFYGSMLMRGFFARSGTLVLREDPFNQRLDATLRDVILEEVTIEGPALESVPVPGGRCLALVETTVTSSFPTAGWRCPAEQFDDGERCHCSCGAYDPDCGARCTTLPPDPACDPTPLPIEGCAVGDLCTWEGTCSATCDHSARVPCASGICGFSDEGDRCFDPSVDPVDDAAVGEACEPRERAYHCAVDAEGFAMGICDPDDWLCYPTCERDADCTVPGDTCSAFYIDPATERAQGICKPPPPPCTPSGGSCSDHLDCCTVLCEGLGDSDGGVGTCA